MFEGLRVESHDGMTVVSGWLADESHMYGLLETIRGFGLRVISAHWNDLHVEAS